MSTGDALDALRRWLAVRDIDAALTVLADRSNLVVALGELPLVARIAMATSTSKVGVEWWTRERDVARHLTPALAPQPATSLEPGPHAIEEWVVSFWERVDTHHARDPDAAGRSLAACHRRLASFPHAALPRLGAWTEALAVRTRALAHPRLTRHEVASIDSAIDRAARTLDDAVASTASFQPLHGDAHLGNVLFTERGALWTDWEDAFVGPIEYDLACLRSKAELFDEDREAIDAATRAYDLEVDHDLVRRLGLVRNVQVILWLLVFAERQPDLVDRARARIARLDALAR